MIRSVTIHLEGGLGNQLFMFASTYGLSRRWNRRVLLSADWFGGNQRGMDFHAFRREFLLHRFPTIRNEFPLVRGLRRLRNQALLKGSQYVGNFPRSLVYRERRMGYDLDLADNPTANLFGYFQSELYFSGFRKEIIRFFSPSERDAQEAIRAFSGMVGNAERTVMIHVRREDTLVPGNGWTGLLSPDYYTRVMASLETAGRVRFLVFSDSPDWCREQPNFSNCVIVEEPDPLKTFFLMQLCDDFIIAGSSLSWWAAWLSSCPTKRVIAPHPFFRAGPNVNSIDMLPSGWRTAEAIWVDC